MMYFEDLPVPKTKSLKDKSFVSFFFISLQSLTNMNPSFLMSDDLFCFNVNLIHFRNDYILSWRQV